MPGVALTRLSLPQALMKKTVRRIAMVLLVCLYLLPTVAWAERNDTVSWQVLLELFPDTPRETYDKPIYATQHKTWLEFVSDREFDSNGRIFPMIYDESGKLMQINTLEFSHICTGDHIANTSEYDSGDLMMVTFEDVIIRGDVIGTGRLTISQLVRLAEALNGEKALTGPYLEAADVNGDGKPATLPDLVKLGRWLIGFYD